MQLNTNFDFEIIKNIRSEGANSSLYLVIDLQVGSNFILKKVDENNEFIENVEIENGIQKYVAGEAIYIPGLEEKRKWGEGSGARTYYKERNVRIKEEYQQGSFFEQLEEKYGLSQERLKHIVYKKE